MHIRVWYVPYAYGMKYAYGTQQINYLVMATLIFPTGTSDDDGGMLLEVHLAGSTQFLLHT